MTDSVYGSENRKGVVKGIGATQVVAPYEDVSEYERGSFVIVSFISFVLT